MKPAEAFTYWFPASIGLEPSDKEGRMCAIDAWLVAEDKEPFYKSPPGDILPEMRQAGRETILTWWETLSESEKRDYVRQGIPPWLQVARNL
jgi:hypothetical protein